MPDPIEKNTIYKQFRTARIIARNLFEDRNPPGLVLCSIGGLGKSFIVRELYKEYINLPYAPLRASSVGLMHYIFEHRDDILIFDDFDEVFFDPKLIGIFKVLLDTNGERILEHRVSGPTALPPFRVDAGVIFLSNLDFDDPSHWGGPHTKLWNVYIKPLKSRLSTSIFKISFNQAEVFDYTLWLAPKILADVGLTKRLSGLHRKLTQGQIEEIITHFRRNWQRYPEVVPRMIYNLGMRRLSIADDKEWETIRQTYLSSLIGESTPAPAEDGKPSTKALLPPIGPPPHLLGRRPVSP